jgi:hypothetical protein
VGTTLAELRRKVLMGVKDLTGEDILMAEESVNQACQSIAKVRDFEELTVLNNTTAFTADGTRRYTLTTALGLTRPKDIYSPIVAHDDYNSFPITYVTPQEMDREQPYPEGTAEGIPIVYTRRGDTLEFFPIPDAIYPLYVQYSQWPLTLSADTDQCSYTQIDAEIVALARDIFLNLRAGLPIDSIAKAKAYVLQAVKDDISNPGALPVARGFRSSNSTLRGEYWNDPFVKSGR